jgi:hypothetical protein
MDALRQEILGGFRTRKNRFTSRFPGRAVVNDRASIIAEKPAILSVVRDRKFFTLSETEAVASARSLLNSL